MTKRHFEAIARILKREDGACKTGVELEHVLNIATSLADFFESENPRFDRSKFMLAAVGLED